MKPWRTVVNTERGPLSDKGLPTVYNVLECGHRIGPYIGDQVMKARQAERRRCDKCPDVAKASPKRRRESRSGNSYYSV